MNEYPKNIVLGKWHKYEEYLRAILFQYSNIQIFVFITDTWGENGVKKSQRTKKKKLIILRRGSTGNSKHL